MIHGPCGSFNPSSPCMENNMCTKKFSRPFVQETSTGHDGYPLNWRRKSEDGDYTASMKIYHQDVDVNNRWIAAHNKLLSKIYEGHINLKSCNSLKSIKYSWKYINKVSDAAVFRVNASEQQTDEIRLYLLGRCIKRSDLANIWLLTSQTISNGCESSCSSWMRRTCLFHGR